MPVSPGSSAATSTSSALPDDPFLAGLLAEVDAKFGTNPYRADPQGWVERRLGEQTWAKQRQVLASVVEHRRTAVRSCHGVGKSHIVSRLAGWWLDAHPPGEAFVVTTAPTFAQVRAILWRYIGQMARKAAAAGDPLPGKVLQTEWNIDGELVAFGRKPSDTDEAAFQGIHARWVLVILDEACGIPEQLWVAADALTTNPDCRIVAIGNPDNPATHFRKVCEPGSGWNVVGISAYDWLDSDEYASLPALRPVLVGREWVDEKRAEWGEHNPLYLSKVLGQFPLDDPYAVVPASFAARARLPREEQDTAGPVVLGVDVGGGGDETVIRERRGTVAGREWRNRESDSERCAESIVRAVIETGAGQANIDSSGIGHGIVGLVRAQLRAAGVKCHVLGVNNGSAASDPKRFKNLRAEMWWSVGRELSEHQGWDLSTGDNMDLTVAQLCEPRWDLDPSGRIRVEPKEDVIERLGRSPDNADALLLAFYGGKGQGAAFLDAWQRLGADRIIDEPERAASPARSRAPQG